jgi:hypothetical protein
MPDEEQEQQKSVGWVIGALALLVAYFGWAFMASDYLLNVQTDRPRRWNFWANSIAQLPNLPSVLEHAFRNRLWLVVLVIGAEFVVLILWRVMKKLERELWAR